MGLANIRLRMAEPQLAPPTDNSPEQLQLREWSVTTHF